MAPAPHSTGTEPALREHSNAGCTQLFLPGAQQKAEGLDECIQMGSLPLERAAPALPWGTIVGHVLFTADVSKDN